MISQRKTLDFLLLPLFPIIVAFSFPLCSKIKYFQKPPHILLAFDGAETFAREQGIETVETSHLITPDNIERLKQEKEAQRVQLNYAQPIQNAVNQRTFVPDGDNLGTVGCVAVDRHGNLAAATSTGGKPNKMVGRVGDTPLVGTGTYANYVCAVSATGIGEEIMCFTVAGDVTALMEYKGLSLKDAAAHIIQNTPQGTVGLVAVSATGELTMPYNTTGMFRACATEDGHTEVAIWSSV